MENHSDAEGSEMFGDWDFLRVSENDRGGGSTSTATAGGGRVLPPWADPSYEWGGGKWKVDGRKKKKESDLSLEDLMKEYSSLPPQIAEWYWCIEYVAKYVKDLRCILGTISLFLFFFFFVFSILKNISFDFRFDEPGLSHHK